MDRKIDDRYRDKDAGSDQEFGEPWDTAVLWGHLHRLCGHPAPRALSGRFRSLRSLHLFSAASKMPRRLLTDAMPLRRTERHWWKKGGQVTASPPREGPPALASPSSPSQVQPRRAPSPQTIETTSSVPPGDLAVCVCVCVVNPPPFPPRSFPRHGEAGQDPRAHHGGREKRKCFIYGTYLISLFN